MATQLQYSCLGNPIDRGAWWVLVHGVPKSQHGWATFTLNIFSLSARAAVTSYYQLGRLNSIYFLQFWRLESPRSRGWQIQFLMKTLFLACRHSSSHCMWERVGRCSGLSSTSYKDTNPIIRVSSSWPHLNLFTSQRPHLQIPLQWGLGFQHMNGGHTNIQTIATSNKIPPDNFASTYPLSLLIGLLSLLY